MSEALYDGLETNDKPEIVIESIYPVTRRRTVRTADFAKRAGNDLGGFFGRISGVPLEERALSLVKKRGLADVMLSYSMCSRGRDCWNAFIIYSKTCS